MSSPDNIQKLVVNSIKPIQDSIISLTFIGSSAYQENLTQPIKSDIDLLILSKGLNEIFQIEKTLKKDLKGIVSIEQGWGLVVPKVETIHLLLDTPDTYQDMRFELFKLSASKYSPSLGKSLKSFTNKPFSKEILLNDGDGLIRHYDDLKSKSFFIKKWKRTNNESKCISLVNRKVKAIYHYIYITQQCHRNFLRYKKINVDFMNMKKTLKIWKDYNLPYQSHIMKTIEIKSLLRNNNNIERSVTYEYYKNTILFLESLIDIIK